MNITVENYIKKILEQLKLGQERREDFAEDRTKCFYTPTGFFPEEDLIT